MDLGNIIHRNALNRSINNGLMVLIFPLILASITSKRTFENLINASSLFSSAIFAT